MDKATERKLQFESLFTRRNLEIDWKFLSANYADISEYEWMGFLNSINAILTRREAMEKKKNSFA